METWCFTKQRKQPTKEFIKIILTSHAFNMFMDKCIHSRLGRFHNFWSWFGSTKINLVPSQNRFQEIKKKGLQKIIKHTTIQWHTMHTCITMHRHCGLHQLCLAPSQDRCSLELHFVGGSSKRIRYFDWSRWLSALELERRQPGISIGTESVPRTGYFAGAGSRSRLWESGIWWSRFRNRHLRVPDSLKHWNCGSNSQFGIG